ncbi:octopamine receptor Oamb-like [Saccostrea echinata]|uniref:octopamine receptor Oamb-like n=1 Tax=Saccostrea echinata TaxID=191078 RepID=UPI002A7EFD8F|nr:octopamine receptor Oamb-like [Saccostrea echinata]
MSSSDYLDLREKTIFYLGVLSTAIIPFILTGNLLVLISLVKFKFRFRNVTNLFIGSLSVADCLLAVLTLPVYVAFYFDGDRLATIKYLCICKYSSVVCSMSASLTSLVAIAVDRYIAIIHPLKYPSVMTRKKAFIVIFSLWIYNLTLFVFPFFVNNYTKETKECDFFKVLPKAYSMSSTFGAIFLCLASTLFMYIRIFIVAQKHRKRLDKYRKTIKSNLDRKFEKDAKSAKTMALILFLFFLFWIPFMVAGPLKYLNLEKNLIESIKSMAVFIAMCNSGVNPVVYCWMRKDFRASFTAIIKCYNRTQSEEILREASTNSTEDRQKNENRNNYKEAPERAEVQKKLDLKTICYTQRVSDSCLDSSLSPDGKYTKIDEASVTTV